MRRVVTRFASVRRTATDLVYEQCPLDPQKRTSLNAIAMSALCQKQTFCVPETMPYSTTSSAIAISDGGTGIESAFAVLRLMTRSNLVGC